MWNQYRDSRLNAYLRMSRLVEGHEFWAKFGAALLMAVLMGGLAQIRLFTPLTPVPFTMQVFGAALMGGLLGARWGAASAGMYLLLGVIGFPVFAGQAAEFQRMEWWSGGPLFLTSVSAWYIVGFIAQAYIIGLVADRKGSHRHVPLTLLAPLAIGILVFFGLVHMYFLANYGALWGTEAFPNAWVVLLSAGVLVIVGGCAWLALTTKARRERVELFFGSLVGLLAVYLIGMAGFRFVWYAEGFGPLSMDVWLAYAMVPFIPVDIAKILLAIGLLTLVRPTRRELEAARAPQAEPREGAAP